MCLIELSMEPPPSSFSYSAVPGSCLHLDSAVLGTKMHSVRISFLLPNNATHHRHNNEESKGIRNEHNNNIIQKVPNQEKKFAKMHRNIVFCTSNRVIS